MSSGLSGTCTHTHIHMNEDLLIKHKIKSFLKRVSQFHSMEVLIRMVLPLGNSAFHSKDVIAYEITKTSTTLSVTLALTDGRCEKHVL